ncbi:MAG: hypothetical protein ACJ73D_01820 [Pyrinomonadaceae bacterium]
MEPQMNTDELRYRFYATASMGVKRRLLLSVFICVHLWFISSCGSKSTDLRTLVPADTLVYLETNDLGAALQPVVQSGGSKMYVSSLNGVQLAIAVTGIESTEQKLNDEQSNAQIKPKFVAVADTHAWHFQAVRFAEDKLGAFVEKAYGSKPTLEEPEHPGGGRDIIWTAADGRKAYAFVITSIVYFSNDRESLDKVLAVRNGAGNLASTGKVPSPPADALAAGYASTQGIAQIADIAGLKVAASAGDDPRVQSAVAAVLPQLIREMITDVVWTEKRTDGGVADTYDIRMPDNVTAALKDTQQGDLEVRLRNTIVALLADSKLDDNVRGQVADAIAATAKAADKTQIRFAATGMQRITTSDTGVMGVLTAQISQQ